MRLNINDREPPKGYVVKLMMIRSSRERQNCVDDHPLQEKCGDADDDSLGETQISLAPSYPCEKTSAEMEDIWSHCKIYLFKFQNIFV